MWWPYAVELGLLGLIVMLSQAAAGFLLQDFSAASNQTQLAEVTYSSSPALPKMPKGLISRYIIVDKYGRGSFTSLQAAINSIPTGNRQWVHILLLAGFYLEKVEIPYDKPYIMMQGEGLRRTIIAWGDRASLYGGSTASSATFTANAPNLIARGIGFMNTAPPPPPGAVGGQAVAVLLAGDKMAFYGCGFYGAQDTLFDYEGRHYFKNCFIQGSIDFIFGHGQSTYTGCSVVARAAHEGAAAGEGYSYSSFLSGSITAQSRNASGDRSGFVFVNCSVTGTGQVVLGRAWGAYSRVVFLLCYMSTVVSPQGWDDWGSPQRQRTVYYGQYRCFGPGANLEYRVPWSHELSDAEAQPLLQLSYLNSDEWLLEI